MKVLYIAPYRHLPDGWGYAAIDHILALDSVGVDVVCRPYIYKPNTNNIPERVNWCNDY